MIYRRIRDRFHHRSNGSSENSSTKSATVPKTETKAKEEAKEERDKRSSAGVDAPQREADRIHKKLQTQQRPLPISQSVLETLQMTNDPKELDRNLKKNPKAHSQLKHLESTTRKDIRGSRDAKCESGVPESDLPKHIAIIMDGNRRYGRETYQNATAGHVAGSRKLLELVKWCSVEHIKVLTVYAFSTENWKRDPQEVAGLMNVFRRYAMELQKEAKEMNLRVNVLSTDPDKLPQDVQNALQELQEATQEGTGLILNICMSYGGRNEIVGACQKLAQDVKDGTLNPGDIDEELFGKRLLTGSDDPDLLIRTSGEMRLSNFLLWQLAYTEMFFLEQHWPEVNKDDFLSILQTYANKRQRRFGK